MKRLLASCAFAALLVVSGPAQSQSFSKLDNEVTRRAKEQQALAHMCEHLESIAFAMIDSALYGLSIHTIMISMEKYAPNYGLQIAKEAVNAAAEILEHDSYIDNQERVAHTTPFKHSIKRRCYAREWPVVKLWRDA